MLARRSRWKTSALLVLLAGLCFAQSASLPIEARRVADRLACLCGACKNTVATCQMLGCHYAAPAKEKVVEMQKAGASDQAIVDFFTKREGLKALAVPPNEGFNALSWTMPFVMIAAGLGAIWWWISRSRQQQNAPAIPEIPASALPGKVREQLDKEMANFED